MRLPCRPTLAACSVALIAATVSPVVAQPLQTSLAHVILIDAATRTVLFERGADDPVEPASTAKLMTADIAFGLLKQGKLKHDQMLYVSETAWREGGAPSGGSTMFARLHSQISVDNLLRGMIVDSANDAAIVLAEGIAGNEGAFATQMTNHARDLGLDHMTFTDAWGGNNPEQRVTARGMALLADDIVQTFPEQYKLFGLRDFSWDNIRQPNRNPLLGMDIGADGLKTGNIDDSGYSLVGSAVQGDQRLIVAIYGAKSSKERAEEARKILLWGFRTFENKRVFSAGDTVGSAQVYGGESRDVGLVTDANINVLIPRDGSQRLTARIAYTGPLMAPVAADKSIATLELFRDNTQVLTVPLRTAHAVAVGSLPKRALDAGLEYVGGLFRKYVLRS